MLVDTKSAENDSGRHFSRPDEYRDECSEHKRQEISTLPLVTRVLGLGQEKGRGSSPNTFQIRGKKTKG